MPPINPPTSFSAPTALPPTLPKGKGGVGAITRVRAIGGTSGGISSMMEEKNGVVKECNINKY